VQCGSQNREGDLAGILGPPKFENEWRCARHPGRRDGLAWTPVAGHPVHRGKRTPGTGKLILTASSASDEGIRPGRAHAGESRAAALGIDPAAFEKMDVHVHVRGAIPKDGPALASRCF